VHAQDHHPPHQMYGSVETCAAHFPLRPDTVTSDRPLHLSSDIGYSREDLLPVLAHLLPSLETPRRMRRRCVAIVKREAVDECLEVVSVGRAHESLDACAGIVSVGHWWPVFHSDTVIWNRYSSMEPNVTDVKPRRRY